jgi:hypothetical protein
MIWERHATDMMCCYVFAAFIFGMVVISGIGISSGEPSIIFTPFDSDGNQCGLPKQSETYSKELGFTEIRDFTEYKYKFFTHLQDFSINKEDGIDALKIALNNT